MLTHQGPVRLDGHYFHAWCPYFRLKKHATTTKTKHVSYKTTWRGLVGH